MKTILITKKTKEAIEYLSEETRSDTSPASWVEALKIGKVTKATIYQIMTAFGLRWDAEKGLWYTRARRLFIVKETFQDVRKIDNRHMKEQGLL